MRPISIEPGPFGAYRRGSPITARGLNVAQVGARDSAQAGVGVDRIQIGDSVIFSAPRRGGGMPRTMTVDRVTSLPPIPSRGSRIVFWLGPDRGGTGDNQHWIAAAEQDRWYPMNKPTSKSGAPGT